MFQQPEEIPTRSDCFVIESTSKKLHPACVQMRIPFLTALNGKRQGEQQDTRATNPDLSRQERLERRLVRQIYIQEKEQVFVVPWKMELVLHKNMHVTTQVSRGGVTPPNQGLGVQGLVTTLVKLRSEHLTYAQKREMSTKICSKKQIVT